MQPIERYAVVTLLFLVVLVVVGALWDDGEVGAAGPPAEAITRAAGAPAGSVAGSTAPRTTAPRTTASRTTGRGLPLNTREPAAETTRQPTEPQASRWSASGANEGGGGAAAPAPSSTSSTPAPAAGSAGPAMGNPYASRPSGPARAPSAEELSSALRREPTRPAGGFLNPQELASALGRGASGMESVARPAAAAAAPTAGSRSAPAPAAATRDYTIRSGDSLERIARRELGDASAVDRIASLNGLSQPYTIYAGRSLKLPVVDTVATSAPAPRTAPTAAAPAPVATEGRTAYTVRPGDSLSVVLERAFGTYKRSLPIVKSLNPGLDPNRIRAGMTIVLPRADEIPGGATAAAPVAAPEVGTEAIDVATPRSREFVVR